MMAAKVTKKLVIQATWTSEELIIRPRRIELRICRFNAVTSADRMRASWQEQDTVWLLLGRSNTCGDIFQRQSESTGAGPSYSRRTIPCRTQYTMEPLSI